MTGLNRRIMAKVNSIFIDSISHSVTFYLKEGHYANMSGAIECATKLLQKVRVIFTFSGNIKDTMYRKHGKSKWFSQRRVNNNGRWNWVIGPLCDFRKETI